MSRKRFQRKAAAKKKVLTLDERIDKIAEDFSIWDSEDVKTAKFASGERVIRTPDDVLTLVRLHFDNGTDVKLILEELSSRENRTWYTGLIGDDLKQYEMLKEVEKKLMRAQPNIVEGVYTCAKCQNAKMAVAQKQTRSGDEGATTFIMCTVCHHIEAQS